MSTDPTDTRLLVAARAGDSHALDTVLARSRQDLRRYAEHHCVVNDVEDAIQETLFTVSRRLRDLRSLERFASWTFRIIKRECNRMRRGARRLAGQPIDVSIAPILLPDALEWRIQIGRALCELPADYREILLLRDIEGHTLDEIASELSLTLAATKSRLHRARIRARELLSGEP